MSDDAERFEAVVAAGGVVVFGADTVYGLACDATNADAVARLYALKRRDERKPSAVMVFSLQRALALAEPVGDRTRSALGRLLPGPVTVLVNNPAAAFPLACAGDPGTLGLRVPDVPRLASVRTPLLQSSANAAGGPDARRLDDVPAWIREAADLVIDAGELTGTASTVIDLRELDTSGEWSVVRPGAFDATGLDL